MKKYTQEQLIASGYNIENALITNVTKVVQPVIIHCKSGANEPKWHMESMSLPPKERSRVRSQTFQGIANAMAEQWGKFIEEQV